MMFDPAADILAEQVKRTEELELQLQRKSDEVQSLELHNGRLRKAVNWLRGALHDERLHTETGHGTIETCDVWECQRARAILEEETRSF